MLNCVKNVSSTMSEDSASPPSANIVSDIRLRRRNVTGNWNITWTIENFKNFNIQPYQSINSSIFPAGFDRDTNWCLTCYPMGSRNHSGQVGIYLTSMSDITININYKFSIINEAGEKCCTLTNNVLFTNRTSSGTDSFADRNYLLDEKNGLLVNDCLVVCCELRIIGPVFEESATCSYSPKYLKLSADLLSLYTTSKLSDATLNVQDKMFKVHKAILAARSPVFCAMFSHSMKESKTNVIDIPDIDPDVMDSVLRYIYSGHCPNLKEKAREILPVADKYDLAELKSMVEDIISLQLTVFNAATTLILADDYNCKNLKSDTINFINSHGKEVINTSDWNIIVSRPTLACEAYTALFNRCVVFEQNIFLTTDK